MSAPDRTAPPQPGPMRDFGFPPVHRRALANGLDLRLARTARLPVASVRLFLRPGEAALPHERAGLSVLTADALEGGTRRRSGTELAEALERMGARISASGGWEGTGVDVYCVAERLPAALELLAEAVREPAFPAEEVERARGQQLADLRQRLMDPACLASDSALGRYYDPASPYARPLDGTLESIEPLGPEDLAAYARGSYGPAGGGLIVAGDLEAREVEELAERCFGTWERQGGADAREPLAEPATRERRVLVLDRPGSVQSEIRVGHVGASRLTPDYFELTIANVVLGGMFTSRLNLNLRERHGFTYGVRSRYFFRSAPGPFEISTAVATDVTAPAVREILAELETLVADGPTEAEVAAARDYTAGIFGLQLETASQLAARLSQLVVFGLPDDYFDTYRERVRAVTRGGVTEAARRHMRPGEAQIVVVGEASAVAGPLEALGVGPVEVRPAALPT
ncbi:MAG TPA: pitrilysin family protein [Longimicrobiales bacterium]|nr:pitrilysin family protein [Longimicrobiales bacterium]